MSYLPTVCVTITRQKTMIDINVRSEKEKALVFIIIIEEDYNTEHLLHAICYTVL